MSIRDYFRSVDTMAPEQVRELLDRNTPWEYNLIDVRLYAAGCRRKGAPGEDGVSAGQFAGRVVEEPKGDAGA